MLLTAMVSSTLDDDDEEGNKAAEDQFNQWAQRRPGGTIRAPAAICGEAREGLEMCCQNCRCRPAALKCAVRFAPAVSLRRFEMCCQNLPVDGKQASAAGGELTRLRRKNL